jgi:hypothetical protein
MKNVERDSDLMRSTFHPIVIKVFEQSPGEGLGIEKDVGVSATFETKKSISERESDSFDYCPALSKSRFLQ